MTDLGTPLSPECVLVVDDDRTMRMVISALLAEAGYRVLQAAHADEAMQQFATNDIDCVLTDVEMPGMNGFELCAMMRVMPGGDRVQILIMTSREDHDAIKRAYQAGANDFTVKHINLALLVERVRFLLRAQRMQDEFRTNQQRLYHAQRLALLGHWERTLEGQTISASLVVCQLLGVTSQEKLSWQWLCERTHPDDLPTIQAKMAQAIEQHTNFRLEHRVTGALNTIRVLRHQGEVVQGIHPGQWIVRSTVQDVTEARAQEDRIRFLAFHDPLTALPNRESAVRTLKQAIESHSSQQEHIAVFALSLDDFGRIASSLGQSISDAVVKTMGDRLRGQIRGTDHVLTPNAQVEQGCVVARAEGDKFIVVVSKLQLGEAAVGIAKRLQRAVASPVEMGDTQLQVSASVGISLYPDDGVTAEGLIDNAFTALAYTKGKVAACQFFASEISSRARQRLTLEAELRQAIETRQFELHYQPRMNIATGEIVGAEALVRWQHPKRGRVMPGDFIPVLEEIGLIVPVGELVIEMAARQAARWRAMFGAGFRVSFNISPLQFGASNLPQLIDTAVKRERVHFENLEVEVTESALMARPDVVIETLHAFRSQGLRIALDDFGTGFSSLSYLRTLPLHILKLDRSFVNDIGVSESGTSLVNAILFMSKAIGLSCVAEGVETAQQLNFLAANNCEEAQGYWLAKPMPVAEFERWWLQRQAPSRAENVACL
ncbi:MAG TPA: EAL domain-containing protein [Steroidobacteraceae bacterium]|nr:EAL domain-containing protein [Steroidobacteraceae bacterium]